VINSFPVDFPQDQDGEGLDELISIRYEPGAAPAPIKGPAGDKPTRQVRRVSVVADKDGIVRARIDAIKIPRQ